MRVDSCLMFAVVMFGKNELINIDYAIEMNSRCDNFLYIDSGSSDGTVERLQGAGVPLIQTTFKDWPSLRGTAYKWCADRGIPWLLMLDADETLTEEMLSAIKALPDDVDAYWFKFEFWFNNRRMKFGGHRDRIRLVSVERSRMDGNATEEYVVANRVARHSTPLVIVNRDKTNFPQIVQKQAAKASSYGAQKFVRSTEHGLIKSSVLQMIASMPTLKAFSYFFYHYFLRLAFLDGRAGFLFCFANAFVYHVCVAALEVDDGRDILK